MTYKFLVSKWGLVSNECKHPHYHLVNEESHFDAPSVSLLMIEVESQFVSRNEDEYIRA